MTKTKLNCSRCNHPIDSEYMYHDWMKGEMLCEECHREIINNVLTPPTVSTGCTCDAEPTCKICEGTADEVIQIDVPDDFPHKGNLSVSKKPTSIAKTLKQENDLSKLMAKVKFVDDEE
jgi:hypothetical protein